jgi:hypothetical protein
MLHNTKPDSRLSNFFATAGAVLAIMLAGCVNKSNDELTKAVVSGEKQVAMAGTGEFFGGLLTAKVTIGRGIGHGLKGGGGGGHQSTGGGGDTKRQEEERSTYRDYADTDTKVIQGTPLPPVTLHLILTNNGQSTLSVTTDDFESELGNFVVDPEVLEIAPGATVAVTPMVSELGVSSPNIPVKVSLIVSKQKETQVIAVKDIIDPTPGPTSANP